MKITFIGTSHGAPSADRFYSCNMIESGDSIYFIDVGAPITDIIFRQNIDAKKIRAVFTTHAHSDHIAGLLQLAGTINYFNYRGSCVDFYVTEQSLIDAAKGWLYAVGDGVVDGSRVDFKLASTGVVYEDENIKVEYIPTKHMRNSYAILVTEGEKRMLFGGDFSDNIRENDMPTVIREDIDGFVCEMAHFGMTHLAPYLAECRAKKVFFTHVYPLSKYDDIEKAKGEYPFEILAPADGDYVEI